MKQRDHFILQDRLKIDKQVPAANKIHPGKWRIVHDIVLSENTHIPDHFADPVAVIPFREKPAQPLRRYIALNILRIDSVTRLGYAQVANIRSEELNRKLRCFVTQEFQQCDGNGISFFTRGAPGGPYPNPALSRQSLPDRGEDG